MSDSRDDFIIAIRYALLKKGAKQKFSLFFLISFSILIITLDKFSVPPLKSVRSILNDLVYRATVVVGLPEELLTNLGSKIKNHYSVYEKNIILRKEVDQLKSEKYDNLFLRTENENLKETLDLTKKELFQENAPTIARVIVDQESPFLKSLIVNKGTKHGIEKGMTVFSKNFLIGTIIETNYLTARVLLITDLNSKIPTVIQGTDINTILAGSGKNNYFTLEYLPENFELEPNKIIYTSGKDGFLSVGMPVAKTSLNKKNKVVIKALADPQQASVVSISRGQARN